MTDQTTTFPILRKLPLILVAIAALLGVVFLRDVISFDTLRDNRAALLAFRDAHYGAAVLVFITIYAVMVAFSLPGAVFATLTGGFMFGVWAGSFFNVIGATLGAIAIFQAARLGLGERLAARMQNADGMVKRLKEGIDDNQWSMLFLMRLMPVVPFFVANLVPAFVGVSLWRFAVSTFFGIIPGGVVYTSVGAGLGETFDRGETPDLGVIFEPHILLPILGLCALSVLPMVVSALRGRKGL